MSLIDEKMTRLTTELTAMFGRSHWLEEEIKVSWGAVGTIKRYSFIK